MLRFRILCASSAAAWQSKSSLDLLQEEQAVDELRGNLIQLHNIGDLEVLDVSAARTLSKLDTGTICKIPGMK